MPLTLSQIAANRASVTIEYAGQLVTLEYAPALITEKTIADMSAVAMGADGLALPDARAAGGVSETDARRAVVDFTGFMATLNDLLCRVVLAWDVYEDDAETVMFPLAPDRLSELPVEFRAACFRAIFGGLRLGEPSGTPSPARSRASTSTATRGGSRR